MLIRSLNPEVTCVKIAGRDFHPRSDGLWDVPENIGAIMLNSSKLAVSWGKIATFERVAEALSSYAKIDTQGEQFTAYDPSEPFGDF